MAETSRADQTSTLRRPTPSETPGSGHEPPIRTTSGSRDPKKDDPETAPEPKRRRNCPEALEKIQESGNFNFTFDTKFKGSTPQFTPKFGSFNLVIPGKEKVKEEEEEEEREVVGSVIE